MASSFEFIATGEGSAKSWVDYDQGGTPSISDDFNVSSVTDSALGNFVVNHANDFDSVDYAPVVNGEDNIGSFSQTIYTLNQGGAAPFPTAAAVEVANTDFAAAFDYNFNDVVSYGDMA